MATWSTRSDSWDRPSRSDAWDEPASDYPYSPQPWRATLARTLGVLGIVGSLALAVYALAPKSQIIAHRLEALANRVHLPWDPRLAPGPEPAPLDREVRPPLPLFAAGTVAAPPLEAAPADAAAVSEDAAPADEAAAPEQQALGAAGAQVQAPADDGAVAGAVAPRPAAEPRAERTVRPRARSTGEAVPRFTPEQIQRRKERYEAWLKEQGLERIH